MMICQLICLQNKLKQTKSIIVNNVCTNELSSKEEVTIQRQPLLMEYNHHLNNSDTEEEAVSSSEDYIPSSEEYASSEYISDSSNIGNKDRKVRHIAVRNKGWKRKPTKYSCVPKEKVTYQQSIRKLERQPSPAALYPPITTAILSFVGWGQV